MLYQALLFLHLAGAIVWVGGMFFAHFCLRPAAMQVIEPPQRLPLWTATLRRFLRFAAAAVVILVASGFHLLFRVGLAGAPHGWLVMALLGLVMAGIFVYVYAVLYPRLARNTQAANWPTAAATLNGIRRMVTVNLILSVLVVAAAASAR